MSVIPVNDLPLTMVTGASSNLAHARTIDYMSVHANGDESVELQLLPGPQLQQVTGKQQTDNSVLK